MDLEIKKTLIENAHEFLEDRDVFEAVLNSINMQNDSRNVIDIREAMIQQLNQKLGIASEEHQMTLSSAQDFFDMQVKVNQAVLDLMRPLNFDDFLSQTQETVKKNFDVDSCLIIFGRPEFRKTDTQHPALTFANQHDVNRYIQSGTPNENPNISLGKTVDGLFAKKFVDERFESGSQAILKLGLNDPSITSALILLSENPEFFAEDHATDLLEFFRQYYQLHITKWLAD